MGQHTHRQAKQVKNVARFFLLFQLELEQSKIQRLVFGRLYAVSNSHIKIKYHIFLPLLKINLPKKPKGGGGKQQQHWTIFCQVSVLVAYQLRCQLRCIHLGCLAEQRDDLVSWSLVVKFGNCYVRVLMSTCRQIDALENTKTDHTGFII